MTIDLTDTTTGGINDALTQARRRMGAGTERLAGLDFALTKPNRLPDQRGVG